MKVFVTGACGQLGCDVVNELQKRGVDTAGSDTVSALSAARNKGAAHLIPYYAMDITDKAQVDRVLCEVNPDAVIHCAAWTAVDLAEEDNNKPQVYAVNVTGTDNIASVCAKLNCKMMYISTDYVFGGEGDNPRPADCREFAPLNYYGKTKLGGELAVTGRLHKYFIVRIAWVFGINGNNFVKTMLNIGRTHSAVRVVNDQIGTPTCTSDLSGLLVDMIMTDKYGFYNATNEGGYISWYDFACEIFRLAGYKTNVIPVSTKEYGLSRAARPFNSRLDKTKLAMNGFTPLPDWRDSVAAYIKNFEKE